MSTPLTHASSPRAAALARGCRWILRGVAGGLLGAAAPGLALPEGRRRTAAVRWVVRHMPRPFPAQRPMVEALVLRRPR